MDREKQRYRDRKRDTERGRRTWMDRHRERLGGTERQRDRDKHRQRLREMEGDRQRHRQRYRDRKPKRHRETDRDAERWRETDRDTDRKTKRQRETHRWTETQRETGRDRKTKRHRETNTDRDAERWRETDRDTDRDTETETQSHRKTLRGGALPGSETVSAGAHPWVQLAFKRRSRVSGLGPGSTWLFACCQLTDFGHVLLVWLKLRGQPGLSVRAALASRKDRVGRESPGGPGRWAGGRPWWRGLGHQLSCLSPLSPGWGAGSTLACVTLVSPRDTQAAQALLSPSPPLP